MGWEDLLSENTSKVLPWLGGRRVIDGTQVLHVKGRLPRDFGWYSFEVSGGRYARLLGPSEPNMDYADGKGLIRGYLVGERLIPDTARVDPDPTKMIDQTIPVLLAERGLDRFARAAILPLEIETEKVHLYVRQEFPTGPEMDIERAYQDRLTSITDIKEVSPALDLAFQWLSLQRVITERLEAEEAARRILEAQRREREERLAEARENIGTGAGRRALAQIDFKAAATAALSISGAELLDSRPAPQQGNMIVQYRFRHRRLECVVVRDTLRIVDSGICLTDERTGENGETLFTLESLPGVINEAMNTGRLVVYRRAPGDERY